MSRVLPAPPGDLVDVVATKWGDRPHWTYPARLLGEDEHGTWLGSPVGTHHARPGMSYLSEVDVVELVPADAAACFPTLHSPGIWCEVYVDVATPPTWDLSGPRPTLRYVDLDLDVVRLPDGRVYVDDEDEFAEHQVSLGYPPEVVALAAASCAAVQAAVTAWAAPYDGATGRRWLAALARLDG